MNYSGATVMAKHTTLDIGQMKLKAVYSLSHILIAQGRKALHCTAQGHRHVELGNRMNNHGLCGRQAWQYQEDVVDSGSWWGWWWRQWWDVVGRFE